MNIQPFEMVLRPMTPCEKDSTFSLLFFPIINHRLYEVVHV